MAQIETSLISMTSDTLEGVISSLYGLNKLSPLEHDTCILYIRCGAISKLREFLTSLGYQFEHVYPNTEDSKTRYFRLEKLKDAPITAGLDSIW